MVDVYRDSLVSSQIWVPKLVYLYNFSADICWLGEAGVHEPWAGPGEEEVVEPAEPDHQDTQGDPDTWIHCTG